jgi:succinyl-CoA synthetase beta subunit
MNFEEHAGKFLLDRAGIRIPKGYVTASASEVQRLAREIGPCVIKAQVPTGKRGKAGGIRRADDPEAARRAAEAIIGMTIDGHEVARVMVEPVAAIRREMYAAIVNDPDTKGPLLIFSAEGGMDIEELAAEQPASLVRVAIDIRGGLSVALLEHALPSALPCRRANLIAVLRKLYDAYVASDAELIEINPLVVTETGDLLALDCKLTIDDSALLRQEETARLGCADKLTELEARARALALKYIELDGEVGVLANGAGLTMTTMDAIRHYGGAPANFMEIGGDSYTKARPALEIVLANPRVKCLLVNFCGAFARTDVMAEGVIDAWLELKPKIPIVFTVHGTGEDEAVAMLKQRLGITPHDLMDEAVKAAVAAAGKARA